MIAELTQSWQCLFQTQEDPPQSQCHCSPLRSQHVVGAPHVLPVDGVAEELCAPGAAIAERVIFGTLHLLELELLTKDDQRG